MGGQKKEKEWIQILLLVLRHSQSYWGIPVHLYAICPLLSGLSSKVPNILFVRGIYN